MHCISLTILMVAWASFPPRICHQLTFLYWRAVKHQSSNQLINRITCRRSSPIDQLERLREMFGVHKQSKMAANWLWNSSQSQSFAKHLNYAAASATAPVIRGAERHRCRFVAFFEPLDSIYIIFNYISVEDFLLTWFKSYAHMWREHFS